jgi:hypothetical protein
MSWVANVLISCDRLDRTTVEVFNQWLLRDAPRRTAMPPGGVGQLGDLVSDEARGSGGEKYPECVLWGRTRNHADLDAVVAQFGALPWRVPVAAQLLLKDQEQTYFRLWMIRDGRVTQYAPEQPEDDTA